jgi:hypothetical protein
MTSLITLTIFHIHILIFFLYCFISIQSNVFQWSKYVSLLHVFEINFLMSQLLDWRDLARFGGHDFSVILRRIILGKNCTALPLEVGARPSHVDHGGSVLNCFQFEVARLIVLNLKYWFLHSLEILPTKGWCEYETTYLENVSHFSLLFNQVEF